MHEQIHIVCGAREPWLYGDYRLLGILVADQISGECVPPIRDAEEQPGPRAKSLNIY